MPALAGRPRGRQPQVRGLPGAGAGCPPGEALRFAQGLTDPSPFGPGLIAQGQLALYRFAPGEDEVPYRTIRLQPVQARCAQGPIVQAQTAQAGGVLPQALREWWMRRPHPCQLLPPQVCGMPNLSGLRLRVARGLRGRAPLI